jgi:hypothetical protein
MGVETVVGLMEQFAVEALFTAPGFVSRDEQDTLAPRIEGKGYPPLAASRAEPQLLHIRVAGAVQRIDARPPQLRPELLEQAGQSQNLRPYVFVQREELRLEFITNLDAPACPII